MAEPERDARFRLLFAGTYLDLLRFVERPAHPSHAEDVVAEAYLGKVTGSGGVTARVAG